MPVVESFVAGAAISAVAFSTGVRKVVRKGVVYGLAGGLIAYDSVASFTSGIVRGVRSGVAKATKAPEAELPAPPSEKPKPAEASPSAASVTSACTTPQGAGAA